MTATSTSHILSRDYVSRSVPADRAPAIPPFERFYERHKDEIFRFLSRRLGRDRAEDAFQETFLRALRAYPRLDRGDHLRAWVFTIAARIVIDTARSAKPGAELPELAVEDGLPAFEELAPLTDELPPKERAAIVLRYGYDLDYETIGTALGSTGSAARQAASAGVRRLRKEQQR
jgi:RNA polymerase sigma factor (sigma-70 family)